MFAKNGNPPLISRSRHGQQMAVSVFLVLPPKKKNRTKTHQIPNAAGGKHGIRLNMETLYQKKKEAGRIPNCNPQVQARKRNLRSPSGTLSLFLVLYSFQERNPSHKSARKPKVGPAEPAPGPVLWARWDWAVVSKSGTPPNPPPKKKTRMSCSFSLFFPTESYGVSAQIGIVVSGSFQGGFRKGSGAVGDTTWAYFFKSNTNRRPFLWNIHL